MVKNINNHPFEEYNVSKYNQKNNDIKKTENTKLKSAIGATIGTAIPLMFMMKKREIKNPLKLDYGLKDMIVLSGTSVSGGMLGGMVNESKEAKKNKFKEGTFQFLNAVLPTVAVAGGLKICEIEKKLNTTSFKLLSLAVGITAGMFSALKLSNKIFDPNDIYPDRKLSPKDCIASADEAVGALALAKFPLVQNLHLDKALPLIYGYCGYRAGKAE